MNDEIIGNADLVAFYRRPEIIEKMRRIYDRHKTTTTRARTQPHKTLKSVMQRLPRKPFSFD